MPSRPARLGRARRLDAGPDRSTRARLPQRRDVVDVDAEPRHDGEALAHFSGRRSRRRSGAGGDGLRASPGGRPPAGAERGADGVGDVVRVAFDLGQVLPSTMTRASASVPE